MKTPLDLSFISNNDHFVAVAVKNPDGSACNISGFNIKLQGFKKDGTALFTKKTSDASITISDGPAGIFVFWALAAETKGYDGPGVWEAVTVDTDGHPVTLANNDPVLSAGKLAIRKQYTVQD